MLRDLQERLSCDTPTCPLVIDLHATFAKRFLGNTSTLSVVGLFQGEHAHSSIFWYCILFTKPCRIHTVLLMRPRGGRTSPLHAAPAGPEGASVVVRDLFVHSVALAALTVIMSKYCRLHRPSACYYYQTACRELHIR